MFTGPRTRRSISLALGMGPLLAIVLIPACMSVKFVRTGPELKPLGSEEDVKVYLSGTPDYEYQEVGLLTIEGGDDDDRLERAKVEARKVGGNAVTMGSRSVVASTRISTNPATGQDRASTSNSTIQTFSVLLVDYTKKKQAPGLAGMEEVKVLLQKILGTQQKALEIQQKMLESLEALLRKTPAAVRP